MDPVSVAAGSWAGATPADLVRRAAAGDTLAFEALVTARADRDFRMARAILGNESDARDATQDAFVSAWRELPRLRDPERFDGWLRRILVNACRAQLRVRGRVREIQLDPPDRVEPGSALQERVGETDVVSRAFDRLDADKRSLLVLHYLQHEPIAAIGAALGVPVGTVKWRLSAARAALERALLAEGRGRP